MSDVQKVGPARITNTLRRSRDTVEMVRYETLRDGREIKVTWDAPIGRGWSSGNGITDWTRLGWQVKSDDDATRHSKAVAEKREKAGK